MPPIGLCLAAQRCKIYIFMTYFMIAVIAEFTTHILHRRVVATAYHYRRAAARVADGNFSGPRLVALESRVFAGSIVMRLAQP